MDCSMPGFPVLHYLPGFAQTHAHWISDAIKPFHPLSSPYPAFNLSQHKYILSQFGKAGAQNASLRAKRKKKKGVGMTHFFESLQGKTSPYFLQF